MEKLVSIIIVNYNSNVLTIECLNSLKNQTHTNFEILLVDNGSKYEVFLDLKEKLKLKLDNLSLMLSLPNNLFIRLLSDPMFI